MINHARTLLLNVNSSTYAPGAIGEEYIPTYNAIKLPKFLDLPHKILFGTQPDRAFLNYRAAELMRLLHQTELSEFIYALDPRVTYWPKLTTDFFRPATQVVAEKVFGPYTLRLNVIGTPVANNKRGHCYSNYTVKIIGEPGDETVVITEDSTPGVTAVPLSWAQLQSNIMQLQAEDTPRGMSEPITLPDSLLNIQFAETYEAPPVLLLENSRKFIGENYTQLPFELELGEDPVLIQEFRRLNIEEPAVLGVWRFTAYAQPGSALTTCMPQLEFLGEPFYLELFGVSNTKQPYATFKNIWLDHPNAVYRFAALLTAIIYRINETRSRDNV